MLSKGGNMREFRISEVNVDKTLARAQKIAQRGQKQGLSGGFKVSIKERVEEIKGVECQYQVLVIEGEPLKYQGWEFIGVAEFVEEQIILHGFSDENPIQISDIKKGYCDHCQKVRNRGKVIFVKSESGKLSQVGSSCVKDFIGWAFYASALVTEEDFAEEFEGYNFGGVSAINTVGIIAHAIKAVSKVGYVKSSEGVSTKDLVWGVLKNIPHYNEIWAKYEIGEAGEAEYEKARQLIEFFVKSIVGGSLKLSFATKIQSSEEKLDGIWTLQSFDHQSLIYACVTILLSCTLMLS
jgi:ssDNA-binding Zn-finger/Zn-ribbon topoisomerase 1